jgi:hypothetical protein
MLLHACLTSPHPTHAWEPRPAALSPPFPCTHDILHPFRSILKLVYTQIETNATRLILNRIAKLLLAHGIPNPVLFLPPLHLHTSHTFKSLTFPNNARAAFITNETLRSPSCTLRRSHNLVATSWNNYPGGTLPPAKHFRHALTFNLLGQRHPSTESTLLILGSAKSPPSPPLTNDPQSCAMPTFPHPRAE